MLNNFINYKLGEISSISPFSLWWHSWETKWTGWWAEASGGPVAWEFQGSLFWVSGYKLYFYVCFQCNIYNVFPWWYNNLLKSKCEMHNTHGMQSTPEIKWRLPAAFSPGKEVCLLWELHKFSLDLRSYCVTWEGKRRVRAGSVMLPNTLFWSCFSQCCSAADFLFGWWWSQSKWHWESLDRCCTVHKSSGEADLEKCWFSCIKS